MGKTFCFCILALFVASSLFAETKTQTSWFWGPGVEGPVNDWGQNFWSSQDVNFAYEDPDPGGQVSLAAEIFNPNGWERHSIFKGSLDMHLNILPADIDNDGDFDLVSLTTDWGGKVIWFEYTATGYEGPYEVGLFGPPLPSPNWPKGTVWPCDMNDDNNVDIVVSGWAGLGWFENVNKGASFLWHPIATDKRYRYARLGDVDGDGDTDIIVCDQMLGYYGNVWLFRNNGNNIFSPEQISSDHKVWRINLGDLDGDGALDIQTSMYPGIGVFLNDGSGHFELVYTYGPSTDFDGSWLNDFNADKHLDIMAGPSNELLWLKNVPNQDGKYGRQFERNLIYSGIGYEDGGMATDVNLDGRMDALGSYSSVAWFEQLPGGSFVQHTLGSGFNSHWIYGFNLDQEQCKGVNDKGDVDIDILVGTQNEFLWYENKMIQFYKQGWLESSILDVGCSAEWVTFGWLECKPDLFDNRYWVRSGETVAELEASNWIGPLASADENLKPWDLPRGRFFQYRLEMERLDGGRADWSPRVREVSVEYKCAPKWFCKMSYPDYAPSGVADFDQKQKPQIKDKWVHCGPTAVANSIWWLDSKFESQRNPNPIPPPAISDNHPLVQAYGPWDDHDPRNVDPLINDLAGFMETDSLGTEIHAMERGIHDFLKYYCAVCVHETTYTKPTFEEVRAEVKKSEDVILLLGFWKGQSRIGGHYVTVSCVDTLTRTIKINDPYFDWETHPPFEFDMTKHNDAVNVSRDIYAVDTSTTPGAVWGLADYLDGKQNYVSTFFGQNVPDTLQRYQAPSYQVPMHVAVEYAVAISPCQDTSGKAHADLDIEDNRGNLCANTMHAYVGPPTRPFSTKLAVLGRFNMVNPDQVANNVDLYDGPGNEDLGSFVWHADVLTDPYNMFQLGPPYVWPDLPALLPSGDADYTYVRVGIPFGTPFDYTFTGLASVEARGISSFTVVADTFTVKVTTTATGGPDVAAFLGGSEEGVNLLKWENFDMGQVGFNLYRQGSDWEGFVKLNDQLVGQGEYRDSHVVPGLEYQYNLGVVLSDGSELLVGPMIIRTGIVTPMRFALYENAPNPFSDMTTIRYQIPSVTRVSLRIYDISGRLVRTLVDEEKGAGVHSAVWSGDDDSGRVVSSGIYISRLTSDAKTQTRKIMVVR